MKMCRFTFLSIHYFLAWSIIVCTFTYSAENRKDQHHSWWPDSIWSQEREYRFQQHCTQHNINRKYTSSPYIPSLSLPSSYISSSTSRFQHPVPSYLSKTRAIKSTSNQSIVEHLLFPSSSRPLCQERPQNFLRQHTSSRHSHSFYKRSTYASSLTRHRKNSPTISYVPFLPPTTQPIPSDSEPSISFTPFVPEATTTLSPIPQNLPQTPPSASHVYKSYLPAFDATHHYPSTDWSTDQEERFLKHQLTQEGRASREQLTDSFLEKLTEFNINQPYFRGSILHGSFNLSGELIHLKDPQKAEVLTALTTLTWLEELKLDDNQLLNIPPSIKNLTNLKNLDLYHNNLFFLPAEFWALSTLEELDLSENQLRSPSLEHSGTLTEGIGRLTNLRKLHLSSNKLRYLPKEIGLLTHLTELYVNHNNIHKLPETLWNLINLETLELLDTDITSISDKIQHLVHLKELNLSSTQLTSLPAAIERLPHLTTLDLKENHEFLHQASPHNPHLWGRQELQNHFQNRVQFSPISYKSLCSFLAKECFYGYYDRQPLHINREELKKLTVPKIPDQPALTGPKLLEEFQKLMLSLNFTDSSSADYLSYEILSQDLDQEIRDKHGSDYVDAQTDHEKIMLFIIPRFTGYFKTLYELPLDDAETYGWQMEDDHKPELKKILSFILSFLNSLTDTDQKSLLFTQFAYGMLHCPSGQKEGLDAIVFSLLENTLNKMDFAHRIRSLVALKKNMLFRQAVLSKGSTSAQNVHLLTTYGEKLQDELGLASTVAHYHENLGTMGIDPYKGSQAHVIKMYYDFVTPQVLIHTVMDKLQTREDREIKDRILGLKEERAKLLTPPLLLTYEKNLSSRQHKLVTLSSTDPERPSLQTQITYLKQQIQMLKSSVNLEDVSPDKHEHLQSLTQEIHTTEAESLVRDHLRPLTTADFLTYLIDEKLVQPRDRTWTLANPSWWTNFFDINPEENIHALISLLGIQKILVHIGLLRERGVAIGQ